jgi:cation diffusion facilitator family transporter
MTADEPASSAGRSTGRGRRIARVLGGILLLNLAIASAKLVVGFRIGAVAMVADGLHSLVDALANVVALVGIAAARRPPDANHPYGHRKYETMAAMGVAAMMFVGCWEILTTAWHRLQHPEPVALGPVAWLVLAITLAANVWVVRIERREGRKLDSELLLADAAHTGSDMLATLLVALSFVLSRLAVPHADIAAAALIVLLVLRAGLDILRGTLATLSDERRIPPADVEIEAQKEPGVLEAHNVRSRGPRDDIHIDLHILVPPGMAIAKAHALAHRVEHRLRDRWPGVSDVVVHVEPGVESERATTREGGGLKAES